MSAAHRAKAWPLVFTVVRKSYYSEAGLKTGVKFYFYSLKKQRKAIKWDAVLVWVIKAITQRNHSTNENFSLMGGVCWRNKKAHKSPEPRQVHPSSWRGLSNQCVLLHQLLNLQTPNVPNKKPEWEHEWNESLHDGAPWGNWGEQNIISWMFHLCFSHYHALPLQSPSSCGSRRCFYCSAQLWPSLLISSPTVNYLKVWLSIKSLTASSSQWMFGNVGFTFKFSSTVNSQSIILFKIPLVQFYTNFLNIQAQISKVYLLQDQYQSL